MSFAVVIPSKSIGNLLPCLSALHTCEHLESEDVIVVDDGLASPDRLNGMCIVTQGTKPFVFSRNCNHGINASRKRDGYVLLNDDALLVSSGGFSALERVQSEHPDYGIIGAVTNVTGQPLQKPQEVGLRQVEHFAFVCVYIPASTIERVGLLDERYCLDYGCDDRDYCEAVNRAGMKVGVYDFCYVDHSSLQSSFRGAPLACRSFAQNYKLFKDKWGIA